MNLLILNLIYTNTSFAYGDSISWQVASFLSNCTDKHL